jgi:hypothetical protein
MSVSAVSDGSVTLVWSGISGAESYRLYYASEPIYDIDSIHAHENGDWVDDVSSPYTLTGLTNHVTWYFVVTAVVAGTETALGSGVNATPVPALTGPQPTPREVRMIELVNRARFDPEAEVARNSSVDDLNEGLPPGTISASQKAPLAFNPILMVAARDHSAWMLETNTFDHIGAGGSTPQERIQAAGYGTPNTSGENLSLIGGTQVNPTQAIDSHHANLVESPGHRENIFRDSFRELGIGQELGDFTFESGTFPSSMLTQNYARIGSPYFITGVVYSDSNSNGIYDVGEGMAGVVITVNGTAYQAYDSGIYSISVANNANYNVTLAGGTLPEPVDREVQIISRNLKLDIVLSNGAASVVSW